MEVPVVAVLDANVLHAIPVCDCLLWVALEGLVRAHWTEEIHEEWIRSLLARRPDLTRATVPPRFAEHQGSHSLPCDRVLD